MLFKLLFKNDKSLTSQNLKKRITDIVVLDREDLKPLTKHNANLKNKHI